MVGEVNLNVEKRSEMKPFKLSSHFPPFNSVKKKRKCPPDPLILILWPENKLGINVCHSNRRARLEPYGASRDMYDD